MFKKRPKYEVYRIKVMNWLPTYYVCDTNDQEAVNRVYKYVTEKYPPICLEKRHYKEFQPDDFKVAYHFSIGALDRDELIDKFGENFEKIHEVGGFMENDFDMSSEG